MLFSLPAFGLYARISNKVQLPLLSFFVHCSCDVSTVLLVVDISS